jgi:hypothetical protein
MAKASDTDEIAELKREVADLRRRLALVEAFVDSRHRERLGVTLDDIRAIWHGKLPPSFTATEPTDIRRGGVSAL